MHLDKETSSRNFLRTRLERFNNPRMINFLQTDPVDYISKLHCKGPALNGAKDIGVVRDQNLAGIDSAIRQSPVKIYAAEKFRDATIFFSIVKRVRSQNTHNRKVFCTGSSTDQG